MRIAQERIMKRKDRAGCEGRDPKSSEISNHFSLSSAVCAAARCRSGAEIQNLSESIRLVVFGHVRSYILIVRRDSCAILYIPRDLCCFGCRNGCSEERVDPGRRTKIFQNF